MKSNQITYTRRRPFVLLLICALLIGILPVGQTLISKATETVEDAEDADPSDYGLNNPSTTSDDITTWDCVYFGNYPQSDATGMTKEPIKWRVLSVDGDDAFLLADKNLDCQKYSKCSDTSVNVTWETSEIRSWLNGYGADKNIEATDYSVNNFINTAFTSFEQAAIQDTTVINENNPETGTDGGKNTIDKVYFLSLSEVVNQEYGFSSTDGFHETRKAPNTIYAESCGASTKANGNGYWWLRSPGHNGIHASYVSYSGLVNDNGDFVFSHDRAVRPALHLNLSSTSIWSYAGTVTSDGGGTEIAPPSTPTPSPSSTPTPLATETPNPTLVPTVTESANPSATLTPVPTQIPTVTENPNPSTTSIPSTTSTPNITLPLVTESPFVGQNPVIMPLAVVAQDIISDEEQEKDITLGKVTALKLKAKKKAIQASWKKVSGASGYELWYSTSTKFAKKKSKTVKKTKLEIKNLKQKKVYFIKVRAYTVKNGERVYGAWSKTVKKKVK